MSAVAGGPKHAASVVAAPVVTPVGSEKGVPPAAAVMADAGARLVRMVSGLAGDHSGEERRKVDGQAGLLARAAVGVVLGPICHPALTQRRTVPLALVSASAVHLGTMRQ